MDKQLLEQAARAFIDILADTPTLYNDRDLNNVFIDGEIDLIACLEAAFEEVGGAIWK
jgi:hypothetical protein